MTVAADDQGLSPAGGHDLRPDRAFPPPSSIEVGELANVVHLDSLGAPAEFAFVREQPLEQLAAAKPDYCPGVLVIERA